MFIAYLQTSWFNYNLVAIESREGANRISASAAGSDLREEIKAT